VTIDIQTLVTTAEQAELAAKDAIIAQKNAQIAALQAQIAGQPPAPAPAPSALKGWQLNETNTGLAGKGISRSSLAPYTGPAQPAAGFLIERKLITLADMDLSLGGTIKGCAIVPASASRSSSILWGYVPGSQYDQRGPIDIIDTDIDASALTDPYNYANCAFRGAGNLIRCHIWGMGTGIAIFGSPAQPTVLVDQCYVHGLRGGMFGNPAQQSHNESATLRRSAGCTTTFRNSRLVSRSGSDSGALFIQAIAGPIDNTLVEGNVFDTWGWKLALEANASGYGSNMRARDNRFVMDAGGYGAGYVTGGPGWAEWVDNYVLDATKADFKGTIAPKP
jgi:hypothetical protein